MKMRGTTYGVGVGPGDPELLTQKAIRLIRENDVIAVAGKDAKEAVAFRIAAACVPEIQEKVLVPVYMPMIKDKEKLREAHAKGAEILESYLDQGKNVVYLTLGDPTVYCTFTYLQEILEKDGYPVELVPGITSFTAAAARLGVSLAVRDEMIHVLPAVFRSEEPLTFPGTYILMKSASKMKDVKEMLKNSGRKILAAEKCGMPGEKIYRSVEEIPDDAGYYTLIIAKEKKE